MSEDRRLSGYFVTGTDTGVGKTVVCLGLMHRLQEQGVRVAAMKPVASGCERSAAGLRNQDALLLQQQASIDPGYGCVNPYAFEATIAPHLAAAHSSCRIDLERIRMGAVALADQTDALIVEGVGGWRVPLNERETVADLAALLGLDILLVVAIRLGCLNHALLTAESIAGMGLELAGWVANLMPDADEFASENIEALQARISAPLIGVVPTLAKVTGVSVAESLKLIQPECFTEWR